MCYLDPEVSGKQESRSQKPGNITHREFIAYG